jgi:hypothetical protein
VFVGFSPVRFVLVLLVQRLRRGFRLRQRRARPRGTEDREHGHDEQKCDGGLQKLHREDESDLRQSTVVGLV